jgi:hypothetical protein
VLAVTVPFPVYRDPPPVKLYIVPKTLRPQPGEVIIRSGPVWHAPEEGRSHDPFAWAKDQRSIA